ncbi:MAG: DegQ family serine endoprotease [Burkholderiales bacterium]|nr:DegQ family serine endoprotease [Burkholderiales bacterium]
MRKTLLLCLLFLLPLSAYAQVRELPDFTELVEKQGPAVVNISTAQTMRAHPRVPQMPDLDENDPFFEFFRRFMPPNSGQPPREFSTRSLGSGFIISADGYILTNAHVVDGADEITVRLTDKREFKAKVIGTDKRTDVALIRIDATGLPVVKLGDPNKLKVGEWVLAIGSPFGFDNTVTAGIVSGKARSLPQENLVPFIQTDAAVNPGNSGGPLFNLSGEVVGINSQIYSRTGGYMGLSFAIPIDIALDVQSQLRSTGHVSRGRIGVVIQEVTKELADSFGLSKPQGALVNAVEEGGPADKAGIEVSDIILKFDGKSVGSSGELPRIVGATRPGSTVGMQVWRNGATKNLTVTVGEIPADKLARRESKRAKPVEAVANRLGLVLSDLSDEQRKELKTTSGVLVDEVRDFPRGDVRKGDIILALIHKGINTEAKTVVQFNKALDAIDKTVTITLHVRRGENQSFVTIKGLNDK